MKTNERYRKQSLERVQTFLDSNGVAVGTVNAGSQRATLNDVVTKAASYAVVQDGATRSLRAVATNQKELMTQLLQLHMRPIAQIARAHLGTAPTIAALTAVPPRIPEKVVTAANSMAEAATPFASTFVDAGLPADFITELTAAATAVQQTIAARAAAKSDRAGATAALKDELKRGTLAVSAMDAAVVKQLRGNANSAQLLAQWRIAKRVVQSTRGANASTSSAGTTAPAAPATVTATSAEPAKATSSVAPATSAASVAPTASTTPVAEVTKGA